ncbi:hypothetical protein [Micromonospora auratinigra]|uniref:N-acetyltransferase domain-containing protein n=1 Tax=Micromonospora auratinigra TaxID=261654 RepID=A0A1A8Z4I9_9ACTN|nr:hypothetical protein [Micromonospora auratinigra]SBT38765.1 hypothetical protein GA0070611_0667 [Micromonospora auratinigra]
MTVLSAHPTRYVRQLGNVVVRLADAPADFAAAAALREHVWRAHPLFDPSWSRRADAHGFLWVVERLGEVVATGRGVPYASGFVRMAGYGAKLNGVPLDETWMEINGMASRPGLAFPAAALILPVAARWTLDNTAIRHAFGGCPPQVASLYRRCGFQVDEDQFTVRDGPDARFSLHFLQGDLATCAEAVHLR